MKLKIVCRLCSIVINEGEPGRPAHFVVCAKCARSAVVLLIPSFLLTLGGAL